MPLTTDLTTTAPGPTPTPWWWPWNEEGEEEKEEDVPLPAPRHVPGTTETAPPAPTSLPDDDLPKDAESETGAKVCDLLFL